MIGLREDRLVEHEMVVESIGGKKRLHRGHRERRDNREEKDNRGIPHFADSVRNDVAWWQASLIRNGSLVCSGAMREEE
jgi:hypothetical protein